MKNLATILMIAVCSHCTPANGQTPQSEALLQYRTKVRNYNQDIQSSAYQVAIKQEQQQSAKADFLPSLSGTSQFSYTGNPPELSMQLPAMATPLQFEGRDTKYGVGLVLAQPLYTGGALKAGYERARKETEMAKHEEELTIHNILYDADVHYWNKVAREEVKGVMADFKTSVSALVEVVRQRVEAGYCDRSDLLMAEVKYNDAQYRLLQAENDAEKARLALNSFCGAALDSVVPTDSLVLPLTGPYGNGGSIEEMMHRRPELKIAQNKVDIQRSSAKIANARYLPQLSLGINGSYSSPGYDFKADMSPNYAVVAQLSIPIFDWGKRRNTRKSGKYQISRMEEQHAKTADNIRLEIHTAHYNYTQAVERISLTRNSLQKAAENEALALDQYREGNLSIAEVIDAQLYHQEARVNYIQSKLNAQMAKSSLDRATGQINNLPD